jgi:undecaprenyl pyrophosphate synthase
MWVDKEITLDKKKIDAKVNLNCNYAEVELPYYDGWAISTATNVGGRDEIISMKLTKEQSNEYKSDKSRKNSKV